MIIVGMALEPFTLGASTGLIVAGIAAAAAGGAVNVGAGAGDIARKHVIMKKNQQGEEPMLGKTLDDLINLLESSYEDTNSIVINDVDQRTKGIGVGVKAVGACGGVGVVAAVGGGMKAGGKFAENVLKNSIRFTAAGVGIAFDLLSVIDAGVSLFKGGRSELGYKLALDAEELEAAIEKQKVWIMELGAVMQLDDLDGD